MDDDAYTRLSCKLDELERAIQRMKVRWFWIGWTIGVSGGVLLTAPWK